VTHRVYDTRSLPNAQRGSLSIAPGHIQGEVPEPQWGSASIGKKHDRPYRLSFIIL
jgi:hypothetical protein